MTQTQDKLDSPNDNDETVIVSSHDVFDSFATLDDRLGSGQSSANKINTKCAKSILHLLRRTRGALPARSGVGSRDV